MLLSRRHIRRNGKPQESPTRSQDLRPAAAHIAGNNLRKKGTGGLEMGEVSLMHPGPNRRES